MYEWWPKHAMTRTIDEFNSVSPLGSLGHFTSQRNFKFCSFTHLLVSFIGVVIFFTSCASLVLFALYWVLEGASLPIHISHFGHSKPHTEITSQLWEHVILFTSCASEVWFALYWGLEGALLPIYISHFGHSNPHTEITSQWWELFFTSCAS